MELKTYQKQVMDDLSAYLGYLDRDNNVFTAWRSYWMDKDIPVGLNSVPAYRSSIPGVPHVCMKVPTGGGKTFMACTALRRIFTIPSSPRPSGISPTRNMNTVCASTQILAGAWRSTQRKCC